MLQNEKYYFASDLLRTTFFFWETYLINVQKGENEKKIFLTKMSEIKAKTSFIENDQNTKLMSLT